MGRKKEPIKERFMKFIFKTADCWKWIGGISKNGYGVFWCENKCPSAHRMSWIIHNGEIPKGLCILHKCDNPSCVNPDHLSLGTNKENTLDCIKKGRFPIGIKQGSSVLTEQQVIEIRKFYIPFKFSRIKLAKKFGVSRRNIDAILSRETWKHLA